MQDAAEFFHHPIVQGMNVAIGGACWLGLTSCGAVYAHRLVKARKSGKRWCAASSALQSKPQYHTISGSKP